MVIIHITALNDAVAAISLSVGNSDKATTAAASNPIATTIAINDRVCCLAAAASLLPIIVPAAFIMIDMNVINAPTAMIPLVNAPVSIKPSKIQIPARMPIATDIAIRFADILAICLSLPILEAKFTNPTNVTNISIKVIPFTTSAGSNLATSLMTPIINSIDTDIANKIPPSLAVPFLPDRVTSANIATNPAKPIINVMPLPISSGFNLDTAFITATIRSIDTDMAISVRPS